MAQGFGIATALLALLACGLQDVGGGAGFDCFGLCGEVFACDVGVPLELCWKDGSAAEASSVLEQRYGLADVPCSPTPRHLGPCLYSCAVGHKGCNALDGCLCP